MKKYRTGGEWNNEIVEVEVVKETEKTVLLKNGCHDWKVSNGQHYHDSWSAAKGFLVVRAAEKIANLEHQLIGARKELAEIEALKPNATPVPERLAGEPKEGDNENKSAVGDLVSKGNDAR